MHLGKGMFIVVVISLVLGIGRFVYAAEVALGPKDGDGSAPTDPEHVKVGEPAPDFTLEDEKGTPITLSQFQGKKHVVLVFYRGYW